MGKITAYGRELRKLRVDNDELLGQMAANLGLSPAMLSSIENGTRSIKEGLTEKVCQVYNLGDDFKKKLLALENEQPKTRVVFDLKEFVCDEEKNKSDYVQTALMFARDLAKMSTAQVVQIRQLLQNFEASGEFDSEEIADEK